MIDKILEPASDGIPIFPVRPDKKPWTEHGFHDAITDADQNVAESYVLEFASHCTPT